VGLLVLNAFCQGVLIPVGSATCVVELVGEEVRATGMGVVNFVGVMIGTFLVPLLGGIVATRFGLSVGLLMAVACVAIAALLVLGIPETAPRVLARRQGRAAAPA
jgi:sugar phosphate permease